MAAYTTPATVITPGKWTLKIGLTTPDQDFTCDTGGVHLSSDEQTTTVEPTLCAPGYDDIASVKHALVVDFQGFLDEAASLWYWLWDNGGDNGKFEFTGTNSGAATPMKIAGDIRIVKPPLDAIAGDVVTGSVTLPCVTEPVVTKPAAVVVASASAGK